jgi:membrane fusion protein, copper/silver efflux system
MIRRSHFFFASLILLSCARAHAQGVRSHTRPTAGTTVSESQAADLTLTLTQVAVRSIQAWARGAATIDRSGKILTASFDPRDAKFVKVGQRVRAFTPESKSQMLQAYVTRVQPQGRRVSVEVTLSGQRWRDSVNYVIEIVAEAGDFLSVPNEAVIEEGDRHVVYVQQQPGQYVPQEIDTGVQGELYTQVLSGLSAGDQVVTFGSFFVDSEYKLKGPVAANDQVH